MKTLKGTLVGSAAAVLTAAILFGTRASGEAAGACAKGPPPAQNASKGAHGYFDALVARPDCMRAFSLRDNAELTEYKHSKRAPQLVTYDPANDRDPRRQDAAKIVVPAGQVSLRSTVRFPIGTEDGTATLVTWDAWFGSEFRYERTGIGNYKTFQFASPAKRIWFEVKTRFKDANDESPRTGKPDRGAANSRARAASGEENNSDRRRARKVAPEPRGSAPAASLGTGSNHIALGVVDARAYGSKGTVLGPNVQSGGSLTPKAGNFTIRSETWTRYWVLIEQRANDWDLVSLWVADEDHDPVQIIDKRQLSVNGSVEAFWLEYNTSSHGGPNLGARTGYARNLVMLRNPKDVASLLQRPVK